MPGNKRLSQIWPHLNERSRRMLSAAEAIQHRTWEFLCKSCLQTIAISLLQRDSRELRTTPLHNLGTTESVVKPKSLSVSPTTGTLEAGQAVNQGIGIAVLDMQKHMCSPRTRQKPRPLWSIYESCSIALARMDYSLQRNKERLEEVAAIRPRRTIQTHQQQGSQGFVVRKKSSNIR